MRVVFCLHTVRVFVHSVISFPGIFLPPEVKTYLLGVSLRVLYLCVCVCLGVFPPNPTIMPWPSLPKAVFEVTHLAVLFIFISTAWHPGLFLSSVSGSEIWVVVKTWRTVGDRGSFKKKGGFIGFYHAARQAFKSQPPLTGFTCSVF